MTLNNVALSDVKNELSDRELNRLALLRHWLLTGERNCQGANYREYLDQQLCQISFRSAPSIAIRSEAELFGISMPRFGYRALIADHDEILAGVNIRRINSFVKSVGERLEIPAEDEFLSRLKSKCRCLADSIIGIPPWTQKEGEEYDILSTELAPWYAEASPTRSTSFVTHFPVGGGMCAQAVCFMASSLLHQKSKGVFGVAEVTSLAHERIDSNREDDSNSQDELEFLNFSGLNVWSLLRYFQHEQVGLHAGLAPHNLVFKDQKKLGFYLSQFLDAGAPVIVVCDMRKLRESVYKKLPHEVSPPEMDSEAPELHSVLVVGKKRIQNGQDPYEYLIHDPATFPYLPVSAAELFNATESLNSEKNLIVVVDSKEVFDNLIDVDEMQELGLDSSSRTLLYQQQFSFEESDPEDPPPEPQGNATELKLSLLSSFNLDCVDSLIELSAESNSDDSPMIDGTEYYMWMQSEVDKLIQSLFAQKHKLLEVNAVDALSSILPAGQLLDLIVDRYKKSIGSSRLSLQPIAIASFIPEISSSPKSERGMKAQQALRLLGWLAVEIYDFQAEEIPEEDSHRLTRIEIVAGSRIGKVFQSLPHHNRAPEFIAEILPLSEVFKNVSINLKKALEEKVTKGKRKNLANEMKKRGICFVLEQEPGPLFTLGRFESIKQFCDDFLETNLGGDFKRLIGLNLDVAHWSMSGISSRMITQETGIYARIAHAHISGHHPSAHFGDTSLKHLFGDQSEHQSSHRERYLDLIKLLSHRASETQNDACEGLGYPKYPGYISLEFEAAPSMEMLKESIFSARELMETVLN